MDEENVSAVEESTELAGPSVHDLFSEDDIKDMFTMPTDETNPQEGEKQPEEPQEQLQEQPQENTQEEPQEAQTLFTEDGTLDPDGFSAFVEQTKDQYAYSGVEETTGVKDPDPEVTPDSIWEETQEYVKNVKEELTGPLEQAYELMQKGMDGVQALQQVYQSIDARISQIEREKTLEAHKKVSMLNYKQDSTKQQQEAEDSKYYDLAEKNYQQLVKERYNGNSKNLEYALFNPKHGGHLVQMLFDYHQELTGKGQFALTDARRTEAMKGWWTRFASNPDRLKTLERYARDATLGANYSNIRDLMNKQVREESKGKAQGVVPRGNASAQVNQSAPQSESQIFRSLFE